MRSGVGRVGSMGLAALVGLLVQCSGATNIFDGTDDAATDGKSDSGSGSSGSSSGSSSGGGSSGSGSGSSSSGSSSGSSSSGGTSGSSGSGSGSTSGGTSSGSSGSSSGGNPVCADPGTTATCTACQTAGQPCQANGCYGGYFCNTTTAKCVAPGTGVCP